MHVVFSTPIFKLKFRKPTETWNKYFTIRSLASLPQSRGIKKKNNSCSSKKQRKSTCDKSRLGNILQLSIYDGQGQLQLSQAAASAVSKSTELLEDYCWQSSHCFTLSCVVSSSLTFNAVSLSLRADISL